MNNKINKGVSSFEVLKVLKNREVMMNFPKLLSELLKKTEIMPE